MGLSLVSRVVEDFTPLGDLVLLEFIEPKKFTDAGLALPETAKDHSPRFRVLKVGPGRQFESGVRHELEVKPGDIVTFFGNGIEITLAGRTAKWCVCEHGQISGIITSTK